MWPSIVPPYTVPTPSALNEIKLALQSSGEEEGGGPGGRGGQAPARAAGGSRGQPTGQSVESDCLAGQARLSVYLAVAARPSSFTGSW